MHNEIGFPVGASFFLPSKNFAKYRPAFNSSASIKALEQLAGFTK
jgi:hypothetical protein